MNKTLEEIIKEKVASLTDYPVNIEQPFNKQIHFTKTNTMINNTKVLVSIDGRKHLVLDYDDQLVHKLVNAKFASVERSWDNVVKKIEYIGEKPSIILVDSNDINEQMPSKDDKINALKAYQEKLIKESEEISKEIVMLNNT